MSGDDDPPRDTSPELPQFVFIALHAGHTETVTLRNFICPNKVMKFTLIDERAPLTHSEIVAGKPRAAVNRSFRLAWLETEGGRLGSSKTLSRLRPGQAGSGNLEPGPCRSCRAPGGGASIESGMTGETSREASGAFHRSYRNVSFATAMRDQRRVSL